MSSARTGCVSLWLMVASACTPSLSVSTYRSVLAIGSEGHIIDVNSSAVEVPDAGPVTRESMTVLHAEAMIDAMLAPGAGKPLIYLHGGLNRVNSTTEDADDYIKPIAKDGYHPILINWNSGFGPAYRKHLTRSTTGRPSVPANYASSPASFVWDLASAAVLSPESWYAAGGDSVRANVLNHKRRWYELLGEIPVCATTEAMTERACRVDHSPRWSHDWPSGGDLFFKSLAWTVMSPVRFGFTPLVDRLGSVTWKEMLRNTRNIFNPEKAFDPRNHQNADGGALAIFLRQLALRLATLDNPPRITIIGHSMGAIVVDEILRRYIHDKHLVFDNIVYLAAASSTRESMHAIHNYLEAQCEARFYSVMLHPFAEDREKRAWMAAPDGSLLVWVDSMFEPSRHFLDRRFGRWENVRPVLPYLLREEGFGEQQDKQKVAPNAGSSVRSRMHFTVEGFGPSPQRHNEVNRPSERFWCPAYWIGEELPKGQRCAPPPPKF